MNVTVGIRFPKGKKKYSEEAEARYVQGARHQICKSAPQKYNAGNFDKINGNSLDSPASVYLKLCVDVSFTQFERVGTEDRTYNRLSGSPQIDVKVPPEFLDLVVFDHRSHGLRGIFFFAFLAPMTAFDDRLIR